MVMSKKIGIFIKFKFLMTELEFKKSYWAANIFNASRSNNFLAYHHRFQFEIRVTLPLFSI